VLYFGALGDRYGHKLMLILGMALSVPACLLAALAPTDGVLFLARLLGGLSAGMAFPTTLALITALWAGPGRTKPIALWSGIGGRSRLSARWSPVPCSSTSGGAPSS
jgi:MFS family permease